MSKELVIAANRHEIKVGILEDDQLVEVFFQRANEYSLAGSIHKGRVTRVLPGMQSAFVDLGLERDTFLYVSDFSDETEDFDRVAVNREPSAGASNQRPPVARAVRSRRRASRNRPPLLNRMHHPAAAEPTGLPAARTERPIGSERPDRSRRASRSGRRSRPAFPPPPWPRPWIPGFQVRLIRCFASAAIGRSSALRRVRALPHAGSSSGGGSCPGAPSAGATDFSVLPGESLANTRARASSRWTKPKKMRFAICRRPTRSRV
jgi:hypothetical protein